ncbi:MAG: MaoC family dehydratase [Lachnospiraceae bacterium]|nr:MaoC family dehydratase [Lachnospiraceae bacterium]MBR6486730.1 MaoC family dehydratase [Lachnospiraceae bacterium]
MNTYTYEEIEIGHRETFTVTVTEADMDKFREITGDVNPLHKDADYAKDHGHKDRVVFGMLTASYLSTLAGVYLPGEHSLIHSVDVKFEGAVYPGDELTVEGTVSEKNDTFNLIVIKVIIRNKDGKKVCKAKMQVGVM